MPQEPIKEPQEQKQITIVDHANSIAQSIVGGIGKPVYKLVDIIEHLSNTLQQANAQIESMKERIAVLSKENEELKKPKE